MRKSVIGMFLWSNLLYLNMLDMFPHYCIIISPYNTWERNLGNYRPFSVKIRFIKPLFDYDLEKHTMREQIISQLLIMHGLIHIIFQRALEVFHV
jgi:hypothetical protein